MHYALQNKKTDMHKNGGNISFGSLYQKGQFNVDWIQSKNSRPKGMIKENYSNYGSWNKEGAKIWGKITPF